jgi:hypothetical protein
VHVNEKKSSFEHSCVPGAGGGRKRGLKASVVTAAASPLRKAVKVSSPVAMVTLLETTGVPAPSARQSQRTARLLNTTSLQQYVVELDHLPAFLASMKEKDPAGTYVFESKSERYNGVDVQVFRRYFLSWGAARTIVCDTPMLYMIQLDGGHMKTSFGGVCLAAIVCTANCKLFPAAWAVVDSENEENCVWFFQLVLKCFPDIEFAWMTDQGSALVCDAIAELLTESGQHPSLCAKHLIKSLDIAHTKKEISGKMTGVRELVYRFARSRSAEWGDEILRQIEAKNADVAAYLRERRSIFEAASFLASGRMRGGRITSQLVESFFNMVAEFRCKGLVDGIIWMAKKFQSVQVKERAFIKRWLANDYGGIRVSCLSFASTMKLLEISGHGGEFRVENFSKSDVELIGDVVKVAEGSVRHVRIWRAEAGGKIETDCPCLTRQELGLPCARALHLLGTGGWCPKDAAGNAVLPPECVSQFRTLDAWQAQAAVDIVVPAVPDWLAKFDKTAPGPSLRRALSDCGGALTLLPGRISGIAGRPKVVKRQRKLFNSHFARIKPFTERGGKQVVPREASEMLEEVLNADDYELHFDGELEVVEVEGDSGEKEDDEEEDEEVEDEEEVGEEVDDVVDPNGQVAFQIGELFSSGKGRGNQVGAEQKCSGCGLSGHKLPKCRNRNIELMLVGIRAMPPAPVAVLPGPAARVAVPALVVAAGAGPRAASKRGRSVVLDALAAAPVPEVAEVRLVAPVPTPVEVLAAPVAAVAVSQPPVKKKREKPTLVCEFCKERVEVEGYRAYGTRLGANRDKFVHFGCKKNWVDM